MNSQLKKPTRASLEVSYKSPVIILPNNIKQKLPALLLFVEQAPLKFGQVIYRDALISPFAAQPNRVF